MLAKDLKIGDIITYEYEHGPEDKISRCFSHVVEIEDKRICLADLSPTPQDIADYSWYLDPYSDEVEGHPFEVVLSAPEPETLLREYLTNNHPEWLV